ncbi:hypothetical protein FRZ44_33500 [Hypericibacter terrae]|uniref:Uncharacterized protein n=1 Tax=Hypericibacter terrae TaxID=2602015 RepID=A0A5J6MT32_9PROT|nr:hypothetical protein [Hypericibacter terrae]QEX18046.1 hypothetical protein FRZ44_33500 [Hypericibacter terrae]
MTETPPPAGEGATSLAGRQGTSLGNSQGNDAPLTGRSAREALLERIWRATAEAIAQSLESPEKEDHKAAMINVARQFLTDNKVTNESLDRIGESKHVALAKVLNQLPEADSEAEPIRPLFGDPLPALPDP